MSFIENIQKSGREINTRITILGTTPIILEQDNVFKLDRQFEADFFRTSMTQIDGEIKGRYDLTGKVLKIELGVSFDGSAYDYINFGDFIVKEHERIVGNTPEFDKTTFKVFDKMIVFHKPYDVVELGVSFPISVYNLLDSIATFGGLDLDNSSIVNGLMMIEEDKWTGLENVTYRNILDEIAQTSGSTILISNGKLKAKYTDAPLIELFEDNLRTLKIEEEYGSVNILNLAREPQKDNYVYPLDFDLIPIDDRNEIVFVNNQIMNLRRDEYAPDLFNEMDGLFYYPFEADTTGLAFLQPLDAIEITDMNSVTHLSYVMHSRLVISSGLKETLKAVIPMYAQQEYALVTDRQKENSRTEFLVDKLNNEIELKVDVNGVITAINLSEELVKILANKIQLEGLVTANEFFKILLDGSMEAVNGSFSGNITADSGSIGRFDISGDDLVYTSDLFDKDYDNSDLQKLRRILLGLQPQTAYDLAVYDFNNSGTLSVTDAVILENYTLSGIPLPTPLKRIRSVVRIGTDNGAFTTQAVAENGSLGPITITRGEKTIVDLLNTNGLYAKTSSIDRLDVDKFYLKEVTNGTFYEQGTWTPILSGLTTAGAGTYSVQEGKYTKVGNKVSFGIRLIWSAHTGTGGMIVSLPFTSGVGTFNPCTIVASNLTFTGQLSAMIGGNENRVVIYQFSSGGALTAVNMDTSATLYISGTYFV